MENKWKPLKLRAEDDLDLQVFSQCIYQAIVIPSEVNYNAKRKQFAMLLERFTWECAEEKDYLLMQNKLLNQCNLPFKKAVPHS